MDEKSLDQFLLKEIVVIDTMHIKGTYVGSLRYCDTFEYYYINTEPEHRLSFAPHHIIDDNVMGGTLIIVLGWLD